MKIRLAEMRDAQAISDLVSTLTLTFIATDGGEAATRRLIESTNLEAIRHYLKNGYRYHVGEIDGTLMGVVGTKSNKHLHHLFVAESAQGKGYASRLWLTAREACLAAGNDGEFTVNASLYALKIYKHWGFVATQGRREHLGIIDIPMTLVLNT